MTALRCTQRILRRLRLNPPPDAAVPAGRLGDWYANAFNVGRRQLVLCASERTLLPIVLPARELRTLPQRLIPAAGSMLAGLGVAPEAAAAELAAMEGMPIGRTRNRAVLGSMNEMIFQAQFYLTDPNRIPDLRAASLHLCTMICGQLKCATPGEATRWVRGGGGKNVRTIHTCTAPSWGESPSA